jgi:hypothetical protein
MAVENVKVGDFAGYTDLETVLQNNAPYLKQTFADFRSKFGVPYSHEIEQQHHDLLDYAQGITETLYGIIVEDEAVSTIGRSLLLGAALRKLLTEPLGGTHLDSRHLLRYCGDETTAAEMMHISSEYLRNRPQLHTFIGGLLPGVSNLMYCDGAQTTTALLLWEHEEQSYRQFTDAQMKQQTENLDQELKELFG